MMAPTVHHNGTSREELVSQFSAAYEALEAAVDAMAQAAPNGRDYYPQGDDAIERAGREHQERMSCVREIRDGYRKVLEGLVE